MPLAVLPLLQAWLGSVGSGWELLSVGFGSKSP